MPPLIPQIGSKSIPLRRTALKKDGQDTLIYLSILLIVLATNWPGWYRLIVWLSLAVPRGVPRAPPRDDWAVEDGDSKRWWSSTHPEEPQRSAMLHDAPRCSEFLESLPHLLGLSVGALQGWQCWYRWSFQPNLLIGMIFLLLHSGNFIGSTCDNLWQLLYIAQRNSWTFGSLWEWFGQRRFDTSKMRCANRRALDQSTGLETSLLLPLCLKLLDISFIFFPQQSKFNLVPRTLLWNLVTYWKQSLQQAPSIIWCLWPLLHSARIGFYTDWIKSERISWMDGMTHNCDTQVHRWKQNSDISDMQHDNAWQKVKKIRIEDLLSGFQHIQSLRVQNEGISCRSHVEKTEKQTQQALVWRLEVNQFFDHLVKNGTVSQELLRGTYQKRSTRIPASCQSNSKTWWMDARTKL